MAAPRGERLIITLVGNRNAGKSSLINSVTGQDIAIVSGTPGTTTDPVAKPYELVPVGPVIFYDTAGMDDVGELGLQRIKASKKVLWRSDIAIYVLDHPVLSEKDKISIMEIKAMDIPLLAVFNKSDLYTPHADSLKFLERASIPFIAVSAIRNDAMDELKKAMIALVPDYFKQETVIIGDIIHPGDLVVCVVPIDLAAPKGRLILPQVQVIREILDNDAIAVTVKDRELTDAFDRFSIKPSLVITDSQVVLKVAGDVPEDVPFTTFSTAFARYKGDLSVLLEGLKIIDTLKNGDKVLISEACSHHIQCDDIGRVKIPRWLTQYLGKDLKFDVASGHDFPDDLSSYKLVIHCGGCMITGLEYKRRIRQCQVQGIPITNYGILISKTQGLLERVVQPFFK